MLLCLLYCLLHVADRLGVCSLAVIPEFAYRKVLIKGTFDYARSILVGPRVRDGQGGYHIVTPLVRTDGTTVLVDRGFVTRDQAQQALRAGGEAGEVQVLGMLRTSQVRNAFTPDNHPEKGEWYWVDVNAMAEHAGGERAGVQPVYVEAIFGACGSCEWIYGDVR